MLPQARRLIGLVIKKLFSFTETNGRDRGVPIEAKKIRR